MTDKMTQEEAAKFVSALAESIRTTLRTIVQVADEHDLDVKLLDEFDNYLRYYGRTWTEEDTVGGIEYVRTGDGGWYSSHC
jgi:hypothetical protein